MHCTLAVNGLLHIGWVEIFVKHAFWLAVCIVQPYLVMAYLAISLVVSVLTRLFGRGTMRPSEEQAVVVTGCDTGFGHELARGADVELLVSWESVGRILVRGVGIHNVFRRSAVEAPSPEGRPDL